MSHSQNSSSNKHNETCTSAQNDEGGEDERVVLTQNILRVEEAFVYKIPPMKTSGGHRAEDWDLAKPLATTALYLVRRDDTLLVQLMGHRPKSDGFPPGATEEHLFAQAKIVMDKEHESADGQNRRRARPVEYWVESVVDSSRYFVVRCEDDKSGRQAIVGVGFRERDDASNFRMGLQEFVRAVERERKAEQISGTAGSPCIVGEGEGITSLSKLSLGEGEKIHVDLGNRTSRRQRKKIFSASLSGSTGKVLGGGARLLPPPPPPAQGGSSSPDTAGKENEGGHEKNFNKEAPGASNKCDADRSSPSDDEEEWGDFASG